MRDERTALRFWTKVEFSFDGCWNWTGGIAQNGYGHFSLTHSQPVGAHRIAYMLVRGPIPDDLEIDHICRNRRCVNPAHLEVVTHSENQKRGWAAREIRFKTHCKYGHEFTPENTAIRPRPNRANDERICIACRRRRNAER